MRISGVAAASDVDAFNLGGQPRAQRVSLSGPSQSAERKCELVRAYGEIVGPPQAEHSLVIGFGRSNWYETLKGMSTVWTYTSPGELRGAGPTVVRHHSAIG